MALSLACAIGGGMFLWLAPRQWAAVTLLRVDPELERLDSYSALQGPMFIQSEWERIACRMVLYQVTENLHLIERWKDKLAKDREVTKADVYPLLKKRIETGVPGNHELVQIKVTTDNPIECAEIANEIAATYRKVAIEVHTQRAISLHQPVTDASRWVIVAERATVPARPVFPSLRLKTEISGTAACLGLIGILLFKRTGPEPSEENPRAFTLRCKKSRTPG
jgi:uncharacterized protein involved in exopolysaccharide biosynthesis